VRRRTLGGTLIAALLLSGILFTGASPAANAAPASPGETLEKVTSQAQEAITRNAYETAVKILTDAKTRFPSSPRVNLSLADLYYDKELYTLALGEYQEAEKKGAADFSTLTQISRCFGKLNQEKSSIAYLTRILQKFPESTETMDDLGWMYFKTHQLENGEKVLLKGIARAGMQRGLTMTLGTIYSGMNRYEKSRDYYQKSVDDALRGGDRTFAAIAYYNLSLLEHNYFHFNSALRYTEESIAMEDRPSGHLARGELFQSRLDFTAAQQEYQSAYAKDTTPLSKVNLAILFQKIGRLELSRRYAEEVLGSKDNAWLAYYGTDLTRHLKDLHELLGIVYTGLAVHEACRPTSGIGDRISALAASVRNRILAWYHDQRFRAYSLQVGTQYLDQGSFEDAWWEFYKGNESYPEVAMKYLVQARALETARSPHAALYYTLEEGKLTHSAELLRQSEAGFDPFWEKEPAADALAALVPLLQGDAAKAARRETISKLYRLNPGALQQIGLGMPLAVSFQGAGWKNREKALVMRFLRRSGSECSEGEHMNLPWSLRLLMSADRAVRWTVLDASGTVVRAGNPPLTGGTLRRSATLVSAILEELYAVH
jgi:tetratricopeptide (TPR) repeat protein